MHYLIAKKEWDELVEIGEPIVEPLIQALNDESEDVRLRAAEALGKIGDTRAVEPLIQALKDKRVSVQMNTAEALGKMGDERAVKPLIQALKDEYDSVRREAAETLGKMGWQPKDNFERAYYLFAKEEWDELVEIGEPAVESLIQALKYEGHAL